MLKKDDKKFILMVLGIIIVALIIVAKIDSVTAFISKFFGLLSPLLLGFLIALLLNRPIEIFKKQFRKFPYFNNQKAKVPAIILAYLLFTGILVGLVLIMIPQLVDSFGEFISNFDRYSATFSKTINTISDWLEQYNIDPELISNIGDKAQDAIGNLVAQLPAVISKLFSGVVSTVASFFLGLIISIYIVSDKKNLKRQLSRFSNAITPHKIQPHLQHVSYVTHKILSGYVYTQITESFILGVMCFIGLVIFGFPYPLIISVVNGLSVLIPVVGAWIGGIFGAIIIVFVKPQMLLGYFIFIMVVQQIENNLIYPRRVADSLELPQLWVLIAITVAGGLFGIMGALLAVPIASIIYQLIEDWIELKEQKTRLHINEKSQTVSQEKNEQQSEDSGPDISDN
ncbi:MAG TPA: AI-2E family transporter [Clostridiaceae bacterium]|nr:AI-2E family transporter [Clostridiaceae bacterium]